MSSKDDELIQTSLNARLIETGERERLRQMLQMKLIECGWAKKVNDKCIEIVQKRGFENVTVDDLVDELVPKSRAIVPDYIKKELLDQFRLFLSKQNDLF
ncbi:unnamed protein product [Brachionus calyciflorus]|uniref:Transcription and mRNA export factor ENY2 n=1 Tax=Brachionus calyciflorus TaxID=104777 RepID=A0A814EP10_9BILA|nr:unnamed protein product [Brachionus calyciflorus]